MRNFKKIFIAFSVVLNVCCHGLWIYVFTNSATHEERLHHYNQLFPSPLNLSNTHIILAFFSLLSLYFLFTLKIKNLLLVVIIATIQSLAIIWYVWQHL